MVVAFDVLWEPGLSTTAVDGRGTPLLSERVCSCACLGFERTCEANPAGENSSFIHIKQQMLRMSENSACTFHFDLVLECTLNFDSFLSNDLKLWIQVKFREVSKILAKIQQLYVETVPTISDVLYVE